MKRLNQISCYKLTPTDRIGVYLVTLERLHNTTYGCPRYKAVIIANIDDPDIRSYYNAVYTFTGHYMSDRQEAQWILDEFIKEQLKNQK